ncbi:DUF4845 domain-containing protein [Paucibacter sp. AS339]|uniref:DUF4845 domain-containing protein n=1 Tax=Paucibacter hankyongi TaxID=3133434 RepID=UPI0030A66D54
MGLRKLVGIRSRSAAHAGGRRQQRGVSLLGLLFWGVVVAFAGVVAARVLPTVLEFYTIQRVVDRIAASNPATVPAVRADFERAQQVEYSMVSVAPKDLVVTKENDKLQISFAYDKQIELGGPVFLLIKYAGRSR